MENNNKWKKRAIITLVLLVLSWAMFISLICLGMDMEDKELECSINVCGDNEEIASYFYDYTENTCYCYDAYDNTVETKFIS